MSKYTHTGLTLVALHEPETSIDPVGPGEYTKRELPGFYTIGTEINGVFVPLARLKAGKLLQDMQRAKDEGYTPSAQSTSGPQSQGEDTAALATRIAALEAAQSQKTSDEQQSETPPEQTPSG